MDGSAPKKSHSLETLVIQNTSSVTDLKAKLEEIIVSGNNYGYDVSSCLKTLIRNDDPTIVMLTVQAVSEIAKCEAQRATYATGDIVEPLLCLLKRESTATNCKLVKNCIRALGNLCCDCDAARDLLVEKNGITILGDTLILSMDKTSMSEIKLLTCKTLLNFCIGGVKYSKHVVDKDIVKSARKILTVQCYKESMDEAEVMTVLQLLNVIADNDPEVVYPDEVNKTVLKVLEESTSIDVSELCLELLNSQAENDSVKTLIAQEHGVQLVCTRLEQLIQRLGMGCMDAESTEIEEVMAHACDLIIVVLTGDEAMDLLYRNGTGEVYQTMARWLDSENHQLLTTGALAIGNFARRDEYCLQLMENNIFDKLLHIFETYRNYASSGGVDARTATKAQHAALGALRNLCVPARGKSSVARAAPALLAALPAVTDPRLADQLLAALRLLLDESSAVALCGSGARAAATWGAGEHARAAAEAGRLLARAAVMLPHQHRLTLAREAGCISCLVSMMVSPHSIMQSEAIVALTLLAAACPAAPDQTAPDTEPAPAENGVNTPQEADTPEEKVHTPQEQSGASSQESEAGSAPNVMGALLRAELPAHVVLLIDTNCSKMPAEVAHNLVALLELTRPLGRQYRAAAVPRALAALLQARPDLPAELRARIQRIVDDGGEPNNVSDNDATQG